MAEYIERDKLKRLILDDNEPWTVSMVIRHIDKCPAADVAPVRHGRWIDIDEWMTDECLNCGARINVEEFDDCSYHPKDGNVKLNYCPHCGAKMDKEVSP